MDKKLLAMLSVLVLIVNPMTAYAYDAATPATYSVNYVVATNTLFTVELASASPQQTAMNFTGKRNINGVEPEGQDKSNLKPWATITNVGEVNQDFKVSLDLANPPTIELNVSNYNTMLGPENMVVTTTPASPSGWTDVDAYVGKAYLYAAANFKNTPDNKYSRALKIESTEHQVLTSIAVTPASANVPEGGSQTYTATGIDQFGATISGLTFTWSSDNPAAGTIDGTGKFTAATGSGALGQTTNIKASKDGIDSNTVNATVVQQPPELISIQLTPATATIPLNVAQTFTATGYDQYSVPISGLTFTWSSSNPAAGTIDGTGKFTPNPAAAPGIATDITATSGSVTSDIATVTLAAAAPVTTIEINPTAPTLNYNLMGDPPTVTFTAIAKDNLNNVIPGVIVEWHSSNTAVGTINADGVFTAAGTAGASQVTATSGSVTSNIATVTVTVS